MSVNFTILLFLLIAMSSPSFALWHIPDDTVRKKPKHVTMRVTSRVHTAGFFYFGGKVAEYNPAFDVMLNVETPHFGYTFFKAADMADIHSSFNFSLAGIHKNIPVGSRLKFTPQIIVLIEQLHKIVDEGSDLGFTLTTSYKITQEIILEETFILFNVVFETKYLDIINRVRLMYTKKHWDIFLMAWNNNGWIDHAQHCTGALNVGYNRVKLSDHLLIGGSLMGTSTFLSSDAGRVPERNGIVFTLSATLI